MKTYTEAPRIDDVLLYEEDKHYSREQVTVASGSDLAVGTVLGKITASGKYVASAPAAVDGSQTPVAVLITKAAAASADVTDAIAIVRHAQVKRSGLIFDASINDLTKRNAARAALEAVGIQVIA